MNVKKEDVFLLLFDHIIKDTSSNGGLRTFPEDTRIALDATAEVMSVLDSVSKSSMGEQKAN